MLTALSLKGLSIHSDKESQPETSADSKSCVSTRYFIHGTGDEWKCTFVGRGVKVIAPREAGSGKIEVRIDGRSLGVIDLSTQGGRQSQQMVFATDNLHKGKHTLTLVNRGLGPVAIDAIAAE